MKVSLFSLSAESGTITRALTILSSLVLTGTGCAETAFLGTRSPARSNLRGVQKSCSMRSVEPRGALAGAGGMRILLYKLGFYSAILAVRFE